MIIERQDPKHDKSGHYGAARFEISPIAADAIESGNQRSSAEWLQESRATDSAA